MNLQQAQEVLDYSKPILLDDLFSAQLGVDWLSILTLQMGPNCNGNCSHCYGDFGPHRKGLPSLEIVKKSLDESEEAGIKNVTLTDGEPLRFENRSVVREAIFSGMPVGILTNGRFARSKQATLDWFNFLKENGWGFREGDLLQVGVGRMYGVPVGNYSRINSGFLDVFPNNIGAHLRYAYTTLPFGSESDLLKKLSGTFDVFGDITPSLGSSSRGDVLNFNFSTGGHPLNVFLSSSVPEGRGIDLLENYSFEKLIELEDVSGVPPKVSSLWVSSEGDVGFAPSAKCIRPQRIYGNVGEETLSEIKGRITSDPIYQAYRLGRSRFLYYLAKKVDPNFRVVGRSGCSACHALFENQELVNSVRTFIDQEGIKKTFLDYARYSSIIP